MVAPEAPPAEAVVAPRLGPEVGRASWPAALKPANRCRARVAPLVAPEAPPAGTASPLFGIPLGVRVRASRSRRVQGGCPTRFARFGAELEVRRAIAPLKIPRFSWPSMPQLLY